MIMDECYIFQMRINIKSIHCEFSDCQSKLRMLTLCGETIIVSNLLKEIAVLKSSKDELVTELEYLQKAGQTDINEVLLHSSLTEKEAVYLNAKKKQDHLRFQLQNNRSSYDTTVNRTTIAFQRHQDIESEICMLEAEYTQLSAHKLPQLYAQIISLSEENSLKEQFGSECISSEHNSDSVINILEAMRNDKNRQLQNVSLN